MPRGRKPMFTREEIEHIREMYRRPGTETSAIARLFRCTTGTVLRAVDGKLRAKDEQ